MKQKMLAAFVLAAVICCGCTADPKPTEPPAQTMPTIQTPQTEPSNEVTVPEEIVYDGIPVETPCGMLYIPDDWDLPISFTETKGDPLVITFKAEDVCLYDLTFSGEVGQAIGETRTEKGIVYVGMNIYTLEDETDMLMSMQESVNVLLAQLDLDPISYVPDPEVSQTDIQLDTAYGQLHFPAKWQDFLQTKQSDERIVEFYSCIPNHEPVLLFRVLLGIGSDGPSSVITAEDGTQTELSIVIEELEFDATWTAEEMDTVYAMQEDMNYLLESLQNE